MMGEGSVDFSLRGKLNLHRLMDAPFTVKMLFFLQNIFEQYCSVSLEGDALI